MSTRDTGELDYDVVQRIARGDRAAFEWLFRAWQPRVFRYLGRLLGDTAAAEELTDDVLLEVWKSAKRFRGDAKVSSWIFGIAHNIGVSHLRKRAIQFGDMDAALNYPDPSAGPERHLLERAGNAEIHNALRRLSPAHREALWLAFFEDLSYQEIAVVAGCPVATVKTRVFNAKRALERLLSEDHPAGGMR